MHAICVRLEHPDEHLFTFGDVSVSCAPRNFEYLTPVDSQTWQEAVALSIVVLAASLLFWGRFRKRKFKMPCDTSCGCSTSGEKNSIILQGRRGEAPRVTLKMK